MMYQEARGLRIALRQEHTALGVTVSEKQCEILSALPKATLLVSHQKLEPKASRLWSKAISRQHMRISTLMTSFGVKEPGVRSLSAIHQQRHLGQEPRQLCASVSSSVKWR